jgi:hypothetical protein
LKAYLSQCLLPPESLRLKDGQGSLETSMAELMKSDTPRSEHIVHVHSVLVTKEATEFFKPDRILEGTNILHIPGCKRLS